MAGALKKILRPRNAVLICSVCLGVPAAYRLAVATDELGNPRQARPWQITAYSMVPLRAFSRMWGSLNSVTLPEWFRPIGYRLYSYMFGVNLEEMADPDLHNYKNLGEFFFRALKSNARPIASNTLITSPCDGKVLQLGELTDDGSRIERVKGVSYTSIGLLGSHEQINPVGDAANETKSLAKTPVWLPTSNKDNKLYYCVIYLAPGDYHRFHSPVPWVVNYRRHFVGELFSVAPYFQNRVVDLFCLNERVALLGKWKYGLFSMTPVGATNVGSIVINFDKYLKTNQRGGKPGQCYEANYQSGSGLAGGFPLQQGDEMGGFRLGSTIVLVFEAPKRFKFEVKDNDVVQMGQPLGNLH